MNVTLTVIDGPHVGATFAFAEHDRFLVGRSQRAQFRLPLKDRYLSRMQLLIEVNPPLCRVLDLNSRNGTRVNGQRVVTAELHDGDVIHAGRSTIRVNIDVASDLVAESPALDQSPRVVDASVSGTALAAGKVQELADANDRRLAPRRSDSEALLPPNWEQLAEQQTQPIPGYRLVDEIGRGAMGVVSRAIRDANGSVVAIKTITPAIRHDPREAEFFLREARILRQIRHPHIVRCDDVGDAHGLLYFAMEYVPARNAQQVLSETKTPLATPTAIRLTVQLLDALHSAHQQGFVHRDVKPSNLLIVTTVSGESGSESLKLTDFGLARVYQASKLSGLTLNGQFAGTMAFIAPEQITHYREVDPASDQFSAAATLYFLLTRRTLYDLPKDLGQQIRTVLEARPTPLSAHRPDLPHDLVTTLHQALARDPSSRFSTCADFREALLTFAASPD